MNRRTDEEVTPHATGNAEPQEWTPDSVMMMFLSADGGQGRASEGYKMIAAAHNAALSICHSHK